MPNKGRRQQQTASLMHEVQLLQAGYQHIFGLDEVGRGPMAGPLVAAAVCLPLQQTGLTGVLQGVKDSKQMTEKQRIAAADRIKATALAWGIGEVNAKEMVEIGNMTTVTRVAMQRAVQAATQNYAITPDYLLIDFLTVPFFAKDRQLAIKKGDTVSLSIAAASIIAKVYRDNLMIAYGQDYPQYGFEQHKGYITPAHKKALKTFGATPIHRRNYRPVLQSTLDGFFD